MQFRLDHSCTQQQTTTVLSEKMAALSTSAFTGKALVAKTQIRAKASKASVIVKASASDNKSKVSFRDLRSSRERILTSGARPGYAGVCRFSIVENAMSGSQSKRTKRCHWASP